MRHRSFPAFAVLALLVATMLGTLPVQAPAAEKIQLLLPVKGTAAYAAYIAKHLGYFVVLSAIGLGLYLAFEAIDRKILFWRDVDTRF